MDAFGPNRNQKPMKMQQKDPVEDSSTGKSISKGFWIAIGVVVCLGIAAAVAIPVALSLINSSTSAASTSTASVASCAVTYSQTFTSGSASAAQCTAWSTFVASLNCSSYSTLRIYGTNDPTGVTITSSVVATAIATALRTTTTYTGTSNGFTWAVGPCGGTPYEITSTGSVCSCSTGYTMRPCLGGSSWGGINGATCGGATQTMSLYIA